MLSIHLRAPDASVLLRASAPICLRPRLSPCGLALLPTMKWLSPAPLKNKTAFGPRRLVLPLATRLTALAPGACAGVRAANSGFSGVHPSASEASFHTASSGGLSTEEGEEGRL
eukprot:2397068-Pyramimonas_sp.AAC.1